MTIKKNNIIYKHFKDKYSREKRQPPFWAKTQKKQRNIFQKK